MRLLTVDRFVLVFCRHPWHARSSGTATGGYIYAGWAGGRR